MSLLVRANFEFKSKNYKKALEMYKSYQSESEDLTNIIELNKHICKKKLANDGYVSNDGLVVNKLSFKGGEEYYQKKVRSYKEKKQKRKAKVVVYTAITGGYDGLIHPDDIVEEWDYILFTDGVVNQDSVYEVRSIPFQDADPVRIARYVKINSHLLLSDYDYCIWIDGNVFLKERFYNEIQKLLSQNVEIAFRKHPDRETPYEEIEKCQELLKDDFSLMSKQLKKYKESGYQPISPLFETNVILRKIKNKSVERFNKIWWEELSSGSRRDQLSVNYAVDKSGVSFNFFDRECNIRDPYNNLFYIFSHNGVKSKKGAVKPFAHFSEITPNSPCLERDFLYEEESNDSYQIPFKYKAFLLKGRDLGYFEKSIKLLEKEVNEEKNNDKKAVGMLVFAMLLMFKLSDEYKEKASTLLNEVIRLTKSKGVLRDAGFLLNEISQRLDNEMSFDLGIDNYVQFSNANNNEKTKENLLNKIFDHYGLLPVRLNINFKDCLFDSIYPAKPLSRNKYVNSNIKVSVLMSCYNVENEIFTSLSSLINQSWRNIEILCVDDNSADGTAKVIEYFSNFDNRVKLFKNTENRGTYKNRNFLLTKAAGDYITVADADDWHHPQKIQYQIQRLIDKNNFIANVSSWLRASKDLQYNRRNGLKYKHLNISSLMFKKDAVLNSLGGWDEVRFAADGEFYKRLKMVFPSQVEELQGVTSLGRYEDGSLTNNKMTGYYGFPFGVRKEYLESYEFYHKRCSKNELHYLKDIHYYPVPLAMNDGVDNTAYVDEVFISDFRVTEYAVEAINFIYDCENKGKTWGVCHLPSFEGDPRKKVHDLLRKELFERHRVCFVYGDFVSAKRIILFDHFLPFLDFYYLPSFTTNVIELVDTKPTDISYKKKTEELLAKKYNASIKYSNMCKPYHSEFNKNKGDYYTSLKIVDVSSLEDFEYDGSGKVAIIMPCINLAQGKKTAEILIRRAGIDCTVIIAIDSIRQGFIKTLNLIATKVSAQYVCYVAQDAYPGRLWLKVAYEEMLNSEKGLLAFNDGKWHGRIASFGMVKKKWISKFYNSDILYRGYKAHKADNEITVLARLDNMFVYCSNSVLLEVDYEKDAGGSNEFDNIVFQKRFNDRFDGLFEKDDIELLRKEYKVKY